jgi:hypothetical protein
METNFRKLQFFHPSFVDAKEQLAVLSLIYFVDMYHSKLLLLLFSLLIESNITGRIMD